MQIKNNVLMFLLFSLLLGCSLKEKRFYVDQLNKETFKPQNIPIPTVQTKFKRTENFIPLYCFPLLKPKPISAKLTRIIQQLSKLYQTDNAKTKNRSNSPPNGSATLFRNGLKGKIDADRIVCRDLIPLLFQEIGSFYGYQTVCLTPKNKKLFGHIEYLTRINLNGSPRWLMISWNSFSVHVSSKGESLEHFVLSRYSSKKYYSYIAKWEPQT